MTEQLALYTIIMDKRTAVPVPLKVTREVVAHEARKIYDKTHGDGAAARDKAKMSDHWVHDFMETNRLSGHPQYQKAPPPEQQTKRHKPTYRDPRDGPTKLRDHWKERHIISVFNNIGPDTTFFLDEVRDKMTDSTSAPCIDTIGTGKALCRVDAPNVGFSTTATSCGIGDILPSVVNYTGATGHRLPFQLPPMSQKLPIYVCPTPSSFADQYVFEEIIMKKVIYPYCVAKNVRYVCGAVIDITSHMLMCS
jgi:hypothetical protein